MYYPKYLYSKVMETCEDFNLLYLSKEDIEFLKSYNIFFKSYKNLYLVNIQQLKDLFCN